MFVRFGGDERVVHGQTRFAQIVNESEAGRTQSLVFNQAEGMEVGVECRKQAVRFQKFRQHHVAHPEPQAGQFHFAA